MILASAIKFKIEKTNKEVVLCGARHGDVFAQLKPLGFEPQGGYKEIEQGFIDHHNNFLTREEAYEHTKEIGQLCCRIAHDRETTYGTKLISEDLW